MTGMRLQERPIAVSDFDLRHLPASFYDDPYPTYRALRESSPVHHLPDGSWFLTRYADLDRIYRDTTLFTSDKSIEFRPKFGDSLLYAHHTTSLVFNDAPYHTRVRRIIAGALTPRAITAIEPDLTLLVDRLLDAMAARGSVDLIADFAAAIPIEVIGNLLDVPHDEREPLRDWSLAILGALEPAITPAQFAAGNEAVAGFLDYLRVLIARRRTAPGDPNTDLLTRLMAAEGDGSRLSEEELMQNCIFILNAGHETTTNLIGNGLQLLIEWSQERQRLLDDPALVAPAVEEFLRFDSSNQLGNRTAAADVEIGGMHVPAGSSLTLCIGAANRDPDQFDDPDRLDIARRPNRHLAFATGAHQCAGMNVARMEARVAIARFLARFPDYRPDGTPVRGGRARFRGFQTLPVALA